MENDQYLKIEVSFLSNTGVLRMLGREENGGEAMGTYLLLLLHLRAMDDYEACYEEDCLVAFARMQFARIEIVKRVLFDYGLFVIDEEKKMFRSPYVDRAVEALEKRRQINQENGRKGGCAKQSKKALETPSITAEKPIAKQRSKVKESKVEDSKTITTVEYNSSNSLQKESAAAAVSETSESLSQQPETEKPVRQNPPPKVGTMPRSARTAMPVGVGVSGNGWRRFTYREKALHPPCEVASSPAWSDFIYCVDSLHPLAERRGDGG